MSLLVILFNSIFVQNIVLTQFLGICAFLGVSADTKSARGMGYAVVFVLLISSAITWPIFHFVLLPYKLDFIRTVVFALVIAAVVQMVEIIMKKSIPSLHESLGIYLPLITTNCAILGIAITNVESEYNFIEAIVNAFGTGIGFFIAIVLFSVLRKTMMSAPIPQTFKGLPAALVAAAIMSLAFVGFSGVAENLFI
ncbi:MAG: RnfABCDGE type electron transport complex subunit A [Coriobacteriia bacterium]|nr:RnfABCDGE type electron transport complex subunit A [Coriobacteriia bacterium]